MRGWLSSATTQSDRRRNVFPEPRAIVSARSRAILYGVTFEGAPLLRGMRAQNDDRLFATGDGCWDIGNFLEPAGSAAEQGKAFSSFLLARNSGKFLGRSNSRPDARSA